MMVNNFHCLFMTKATRIDLFLWSKVLFRSNSKNRLKIGLFFPVYCEIGQIVSVLWGCGFLRISKQSMLSLIAARLLFFSTTMAEMLLIFKAPMDLGKEDGSRSS